MKYLTAGLILVGSAIVIGGLMAVPVYLLWNWLMPKLFGLGKIGLLEAFGVCWLSRILFVGGLTSDKE